VPIGTFAIPLETLGDSVEDDFAISDLAALVRASSAPDVYVRRSQH
jgi:hypothetical protein